MSLTPNAVQRLASCGGGGRPPPDFQPVVQLIDVRRMQNPSGDRYRVMISDGQAYLPGMMATQLNKHMEDGQVKHNSFVRVQEFLTNVVQGKIVVIVLKMQVVRTDGDKVGNPQEYKATGAANAGAGVPQAQPMYGNTAPQGNHAGNGMVKTENAYSRSASGAQGKENHYNSYNNNANRYAGGASSSSSSAPIVRSHGTSSQHYMPIAQLNMYQNRWTIKARVTNKSQIRSWSNARGEGTLFSVDLLDSSNTDIKATFFKEAVDKFYNMLNVDTVYTFSGGRLKVANMQYNTCKSQFEITFDVNCEIHQVGEDTSIQHGTYDICKIANLEQVEPNSYVDIVGIVSNVAPVSTVMSKKTQMELFKCELTIVDDSQSSVSLTLWGESSKTAERDYAGQPLVAFKKVRVSDYGGRSVSVAGGAIVQHPQIPEAQAIRQWWTSQGGTTAAIKSVSTGGGGGGIRDSFESRKTISAIRDERLGFNEKPDWITFKATFSFIKKDKEGGPWYTACANANDPCKNRPKVTQTTDMCWYCEKCSQTNTTCVRRFIFSATVSDDTCTTWLSLFDEQARVLLNGGNSNANQDANAASPSEEITADMMHKLYFENEEADMDGFDSIFTKATHTDWIVKCKVKQEMVADESRIKTSVYALKPVDYVQESRDMLKAIAAMG